MQEITHSLVDLLLGLVHRLELRAERKADRELLEDLKRVTGKNNLLFQLRRAARCHIRKALSKMWPQARR
jgi:hypothetical protein